MAELVDTSTGRTLSLENSSDYPEFDGQLLPPPINTPHWLPAVIILPLAAVIALTLAVVCMLTRATRLFRANRTVILTDPAMLSNVHSISRDLKYVGAGAEPYVYPSTTSATRPTTAAADYGGKSNPAFESTSTTSVVDKNAQSKL